MKPFKQEAENGNEEKGKGRELAQAYMARAAQSFQGQACSIIGEKETGAGEGKDKRGARVLSEKTAQKVTPRHLMHHRGIQCDAAKGQRKMRARD